MDWILSQKCLGTWQPFGPWEVEVEKINITMMLCHWEDWHVDDGDRLLNWCRNPWLSLKRQFRERLVMNAISGITYSRVRDKGTVADKGIFYTSNLTTCSPLLLSILSSRFATHPYTMRELFGWDGFEVPSDRAASRSLTLERGRECSTEDTKRPTSNVAVSTCGSVGVPIVTVARSSGGVTSCMCWR
jgi:hypothetical protein